MTLLTIDYKNGLPAMFHSFVRVAVTYFLFARMLANFVPSSSCSHYHFLVGSAAIKEVTFPQAAGIIQGELFSPQLFLFCTAIVMSPMHQL